MRRKLLPVIICLPLCLLLLPDRAPVVLSITASGGEQAYCDDGQPLPEAPTFEMVAARDPVAALDLCLKRHHREIKGYSGLLKKHERIKGKEHPPELIDFWFREDPYSVLMKWRQGARNCKASLYAEGQNSNKVAVVTNTRIPVTWDIDPLGRMAQDAGRYNIREFSIRQATERTLSAWRDAQENKNLFVDFKPNVAVAELDGRKCHILTRTCKPVEEDGVLTVEIMIDAETWLQTGSTLTDANGGLIGRYFFCNLQSNPTYAAGQFERSQIKK